jgi:hypothetical protein
MTSTICGGSTPRSSTRRRSVMPVVNLIGQLPLISGLALGLAPGSALAEGDGDGLALSDGWQSAVARSSS